MMENRPIWDAIRMEAIEHEKLPPMGTYQFLLKKLLDTFGHSHTPEWIHEYRQKHGAGIRTARKERVEAIDDTLPDTVKGLRDR